jgi:glycosyltransferase involved in cell wall biosynthesis
LRVLLLYDCVYPESLGGIEARNHELALALAARGHRVQVVGWAREARAPAPGVTVVPLHGHQAGSRRVGRRRGRDALRFARAVRRLRLGDAELVETANIPFAHLFPLALRCALARKPLVVTWHEVWGRHWRDFLADSPLGRLAWPVFAAIELLALQLGTVALAVSPLTHRRLARRRLRGAPLLIPNGVTVEAVRAAAGGQPPGPPLIYAGRLLADKRVDLLLRAVARLDVEPSAAGPLLTVIGDGPERARLEALAGELGIASRVVFTGRLATPEEVWRRLGAASIAVQPSSREGFGLFPLEAMAAGLPVVYCAAERSAVGEVVRHGVEGLESAPEPAALAATLRGLLADAAGRERLSAAARGRAEEHDWREVARRLEEALAPLAAASRARMTALPDSPSR